MNPLTTSFSSAGAANTGEKLFGEDLDVTELSTLPECVEPDWLEKLEEGEG